MRYSLSGKMFSKRIKEDTIQIKDLEGLLSNTVKGKILKHDIKPLTAFGENFGSEILKVDITLEENGEEKVLHTVGKLIPPTEQQMEIFNTQVTFKNEIGFYADAVPALHRFQRENGTEGGTDYFPKLYGARTSLKPNSDVVDFDAVILMENLKIGGFHNIDRIKGFDLHSAKTVIQALASFQATALALRKLKEEEFNKKIKPYLSEWKPPHFADSPMFDSVFSENPNTSPYKSKIQKLATKKRVKKISDTWATITHNDLWVNNIMVKGSNDVITQVKFVDFQVPDYGSPATDIIFFLFTSVQTSVLHYHFEKLLRHYHTEFVAALQSFKIDTKLYTYESFQEELRQEAPYQIHHSLFMIIVILSRPEDLPKKPGEAPKWNPDGQEADVEPSANNNGDDGKSKPPAGRPPFKFPLHLKERVWFIVEEAAKQKWI